LVLTGDPDELNRSPDGGTSITIMSTTRNFLDSKRHHTQGKSPTRL
jgi:hypothetical protein